MTERAQMVSWAPAPLVRGVYLLVAGDRVLYVGQSNDIARRIVAHREIAFERVVAIDVPETNEESCPNRKACEGILIRELQPPHNELPAQGLFRVDDWETWLGVRPVRSVVLLIAWLMDVPYAPPADEISQRWKTRSTPTWAGWSGNASGGAR